MKIKLANSTTQRNMKIVFLLVVLTTNGFWAPNLPLEENIVHHQSERQMSDKNTDAVKLYLLGKACDYGASFHKYNKQLQ
jgi:hypothetical protein